MCLNTYCVTGQYWESVVAAQLCIIRLGFLASSELRLAVLKTGVYTYCVTGQYWESVVAAQLCIIRLGFLASSELRLAVLKTNAKRI